MGKRNREESSSDEVERKKKRLEKESEENGADASDSPDSSLGLPEDIFDDERDLEFNELDDFEDFDDESETDDEGSQSNVCEVKQKNKTSNKIVNTTSEKKKKNVSFEMSKNTEHSISSSGSSSDSDDSERLEEVSRPASTPQPKVEVKQKKQKSIEKEKAMISDSPKEVPSSSKKKEKVLQESPKVHEISAIYDSDIPSERDERSERKKSIKSPEKSHVSNEILTDDEDSGYAVYLIRKPIEISLDDLSNSSNIFNSEKKKRKLKTDHGSYQMTLADLPTQMLHIPSMENTTAKSLRRIKAGSKITAQISILKTHKNPAGGPIIEDVNEVPDDMDWDLPLKNIRRKPKLDLSQLKERVVTSFHKSG